MLNLAYIIIVSVLCANTSTQTIVQTGTKNSTQNGTNSITRTDPIDSNRRIYRGSHVSITSVPYFAVIFWWNHNVRCGSSIINPRFLVAAAHCFPPGRFYVKVGTDLTYQGQRYEIERIMIHPNYWTNDYIFVNDVSVVKLSAILVYSNRVNQIQLAPTNLFLQPGTLLLTMGFGETESSKFSYQLLSAEVPYVDLRTCSNILQFNLGPNMICAGGVQGKDVCRGDSGGPLVYNNMLVGLVSFGKRCGVDLPSVYTNVPYLSDFINSAMREIY